MSEVARGRCPMKRVRLTTRMLLFIVAAFQQQACWLTAPFALLVQTGRPAWMESAGLRFSARAFGSLSALLDLRMEARRSLAGRWGSLVPRRRLVHQRAAIFGARTFAD